MPETTNGVIQPPEPGSVSGRADWTRQSTSAGSAEIHRIAATEDPLALSRAVGATPRWAVGRDRYDDRADANSGGAILFVSTELRAHQSGCRSWRCHSGAGGVGARRRTIRWNHRLRRRVLPATTRSLCPSTAHGRPTRLSSGAAVPKYRLGDGASGIGRPQRDLERTRPARRFDAYARRRRRARRDRQCWDLALEMLASNRSTALAAPRCRSRSLQSRGRASDLETPESSRGVAGSIAIQIRDVSPERRPVRPRPSRMLERARPRRLEFPTRFQARQGAESSLPA